MWYCDQPYGINKIKATIKEMCKEAGLVGKFTNHSLHATCASRMYDKDVPEQLIKEVTGHHSECVRTYKRTSDQLRESVSHTVSKVAKISREQNVKGDDNHLESKVVVKDEVPEELGPLSMEQMIENVKKTKMEIR